MIERTCENCKHSYYRKLGWGVVKLSCKLGEFDFIECQIAGTDDCFEPKGEEEPRPKMEAVRKHCSLEYMHKYCDSDCGQWKRCNNREG